MTNSSLSFALKALSALAVCAMLAGCGSGDGLAELAESRAAYARHDLKNADKWADKAVGCDSGNVDALVHSVRVKIERGLLPEARKHIAKAMQLDGEADDVLLTDAEVAYLSRDFNKAMFDCRKVAEDAARSPEVRAQAYNMIGVVMFTTQDYDAARVALLRALRLDRLNPAVMYNLGRLYRDGFDYPMASKEMFGMYLKSETYADVRMQRVQHSYIQELNDAIARKRASRAGSSQCDSERAAALIQEGEDQAARGNPRNARAKFEAALKADPLSFEAARRLAEIWPKADRTPEGMKKQLSTYKIACELQPGRSDVLLKTADLAFRLQYHGDAADLYSRAFAMDWTSMAALDGLIKSNRKLGREDVAKIYQAYREELAASRR